MENIYKSLISKRFIECFDYLKINYQFRSKTQLAEKLGINKQRISDIRRGKHDVSTEFITILITNYTEINIDYIMTGEGNMLVEKRKEYKMDQKKDILLEPITEYIKMKDELINSLKEVLTEKDKRIKMLEDKINEYENMQHNISTITPSTPPSK